MEDILIVVLAFGLMILGCIGTFLPVLPGVILSILGMIAYKLSSFAVFSWNPVIVAGVFVGLSMLADYLIPLYGVKKMGGSKYGIYGSVIGLFVGIIFSPFGGVSILICPFLGAFIGEWFRQNDKKNALKAAVGSFIGFLMSTGLALFISLFILFYCMVDLSGNLEPITIPYFDK